LCAFVCGSPRVILSPFGQGAVAALIDGHLYLAVAPMLYDYGSPESLHRTPNRILTSLVSPPTFISGGFAYAEVDDSGKKSGEILDLRGGHMRAIWTEVQSAATVVRYDALLAPHLVGLNAFLSEERASMFVRATDGAQIVTANSCGSFASDDHYVIAVCGKSPSSVGAQMIEAFKFP
jgi:hypothetical protein